MEPDNNRDWIDDAAGFLLGAVAGALLIGLLSGCGAVYGAADALTHPQQERRTWQEPVRQHGNAVVDSTGKRGLVIGNGVLMPNGQRYLTITDGFGQRWITDDNGHRVRVR